MIDRPPAAVLWVLLAGAVIALPLIIWSAASEQAGPAPKPRKSAVRFECLDRPPGVQGQGQVCFRDPPYHPEAAAN